MGNEIFANRVRKLRTDKQMTLEGLASALGLNKSRVGMWETNGTVPRDDVLIELSKFFNVSIDYLLGNDSMQGKEPESERLLYLQRGLKQMDEANLKKTEKILSVMFDDIFNNLEEDDCDI